VRRTARRTRRFSEGCHLDDRLVSRHGVSLRDGLPLAVAARGRAPHDAEAPRSLVDAPHVVEVPRALPDLSESRERALG